MGITSTGSGKRPSRSTTFCSSTMQTNSREQAATIFSRVRAPPPPLMRASARVASSAPSTYTPISPVALRSRTSMPSFRRRWVLASLLETAPATRSRSAASASMKKLTVEPVPTPMTEPSCT